MCSAKKGKAWAAVSESLKENNTIDNMVRLFKTAKANNFEVFISPHYFFPEDKGWKFNGPLETDEVNNSGSLPNTVFPMTMNSSYRASALRKRELHQVMVAASRWVRAQTG
jgi:hypothetical protein